MLTTQQKQQLKSQAHSLSPVVMIGDKGLTSNVMEEINQALTAHELIKIKIAGADRQVRQDMGNQIAQSANAHEIQYIGHILVLYRQNLDKKKRSEAKKR